MSADTLAALAARVAALEARVAGTVSFPALPVDEAADARIEEFMRTQERPETAGWPRMPESVGDAIGLKHSVDAAPPTAPAARGVDSIGTCTVCGYYGPGPAHACRPHAAPASACDALCLGDCSLAADWHAPPLVYDGPHSRQVESGCKLNWTCDGTGPAHQRPAQPEVPADDAEPVPRALHRAVVARLQDTVKAERTGAHAALDVTAAELRALRAAVEALKAHPCVEIACNHVGTHDCCAALEEAIAALPGGEP